MVENQKEQNNAFKWYLLLASNKIAIVNKKTKLFKYLTDYIINYLIPIIFILNKKTNSTDPLTLKHFLWKNASKLPSF